MTMGPRLRKLVLTAHVVSSVGWLGAAVAYAALVVAAVSSEDAQLVRAAYLALQPITWFAIVPLAAGTLVTGLLQSLGTRWGLVRHFWVIYKLGLSVLATLVLLGNTRTVSALVSLAVETEQPAISGLQGQLLHAGGGALVLLLATVLAIYKPRGVTRYGWRKQHEERTVSPP